MNNNANYFTYHHPSDHHRIMHQQFILKFHTVSKFKHLSAPNFQISYRPFRPFIHFMISRGKMLTDILNQQKCSPLILAYLINLLSYLINTHNEKEVHFD